MIKVVDPCAFPAQGEGRSHDRKYTALIHAPERLRSIRHAQQYLGMDAGFPGAVA
jgi:hypothetical protein